MRTRLPSLLAALCIVIGFQALWSSVPSGYSADDFLFVAMMDGEFAVPRHPLDLYNFIDGTPEEGAALRAQGYPWWTPDELRLKMLRPLAAALLWVDQLLFGDAVWLHHVHSLVWWLVLIVGAQRLYRDRFPTGLALGALLLYAVDMCQHTPVGWLANRGGLVSVAIGLWGLLAYLRWRGGGPARFAWISALLFSVALAAGEWVFCLFAYLFAYELLEAKGPLLRRALCLTPGALPALGFVVIRWALDYGVRASGVYVDPIRHPLAFFEHLGERLLIFMGDMVLDVDAVWWGVGTPWRDAILRWGKIPPRIWLELPSWHTWQLVLGALAWLIVIVGVRLAWRDAEARTRASLRWMMLGGVLAMLPVAGSFPSTRLLLVPMLSLAPVGALLLRALFRVVVDAALRGRPLRYALAFGLCALALDAHVRRPAFQDRSGIVHHVRNLEFWAKHAELDPARVADQAVVLLNGIEFSTTVYFPFTWYDSERPVPGAVYTLTLNPHAHLLRRVSSHAFDLEVLGGTFMATDPERHFRADSMPLRVGQRIELRDLSVEIRALQQGLPRTVRFTFRQPLESERYVFLSADGDGLRRREMPDVGGELLLPRGASPSFHGFARGRYEDPMRPFPDFLLYDPVPYFVEFEPI